VRPARTLLACETRTAGSSVQVPCNHSCKAIAPVRLISVLRLNPGAAPLPRLRTAPPPQFARPERLYARVASVGHRATATSARA
jgi:hypothetical protein